MRILLPVLVALALIVSYAVVEIAWRTRYAGRKAWHNWMSTTAAILAAVGMAGLLLFQITALPSAIGSAPVLPMVYAWIGLTTSIASWLLAILFILAWFAGKILDIIRYRNR